MAQLKTVFCLGGLTFAKEDNEKINIKTGQVIEKVQFEIFADSKDEAVEKAKKIHSMDRYDLVMVIEKYELNS